MSSVQQYVSDCQSARLSRATIDAYRYAFKLFGDFIGDVDLLEIADATALREFFAWLEQRPCSNSRKPPTAATLHQVNRSLTTYFGWLIRQRLRTDNPMTLLRKPRIPKRLRPRLSNDDLNQLLTAASQTETPSRDVALLLVLIDCGVRIGEVSALNIEDVSLCERRFTVVGKGDKERAVPFGQKTAEALSVLIGDQWAGPVFKNQNDGRLLKGGARRIVQRIAYRAGLEGLNPHDLRHTMARKWLERGDLRSLQLILGHAKISTTEIYTALNEDDLSEAHALAGVADRL